jgi:hypothetical protein
MSNPSVSIAVEYAVDRALYGAMDNVINGVVFWSLYNMADALADVLTWDNAVWEVLGEAYAPSDWDTWGVS